MWSPRDGNPGGMHVREEAIALLGIGGLPGAGPGIAGFSAWLVAAAVLAVLGVLAWWTARPTRRASARPASAPPRGRPGERPDETTRERHR